MTLPLKPQFAQPDVVVGRRTNCDRCGNLQAGCIWVRRTDDPRDLADQWCLCAGCRAVWRRAGIPFLTSDVDFPEAQ
jgi:hypothetical protein